MKDLVSLITVMEQSLKLFRSKYGEFEVDVPQDRQSSFEPQVLPKRQKDISAIDDKIIAMYAKGMTTRQISETIEDVYGFEVSEGMVSGITDKLLPKNRGMAEPSFVTCVSNRFY